MLKNLLIVSSITLGTSLIATDAGACGLFGHHRSNNGCQAQTTTTCCPTSGYSIGTRSGWGYGNRGFGW